MYSKFIQINKDNLILYTTTQQCEYWILVYSLTSRTQKDTSNEYDYSPVNRPINKNQGTFVINSSQFKTARKPTTQVIEELKRHSVNGPQVAINCKNLKFQIQFPAPCSPMIPV